MTGPIARGGGVSITPDDLIVAIKLGPSRSLLETILFRKVAVARAVAEALVVDDDEIEDATSSFFAELDLFEEEHIDAWLREQRLDEDAVRGYLRESILIGKLKQHLVPDETVARRYQASMHDYATVHVETIRLESSGAASELMLGVKEGEITWSDAAGRCGGMLTATLRRADAPEEIAAHLFAAAAGRLVGPVENDQGSYTIYRVLSRSEPELDDALRERIREELFNEEIGRALSKEPLSFL